MSIRAALINLVLKHTVKKQFASEYDPADLREQAGGSLAPAPPDELITEQVDAGGVPAEWVLWPGVSEDHVLLYLHGGGYVFGGPDSHRDLAWRLGKEAGMRVLVSDYRLAPEHPFPSAVDDATECYKWLLDQGYAPGKIAVAGDSAGGGLTAALVVNLKNHGLPLPKATVLISPWADLAATGESMQANAEADPMLSPQAIKYFAEHYLGDRDPKAPLASPIYADLTDFPPTYIVVGSTEVLLSDAERLAAAINDAGGQAELKVWPKMPHVFPLLASRIPEGKQSVTEISEFLVGQMGTTAVD